MRTMIPIRLLEKDANRRGDLFGRLMADLFVALGYNQPRLNIHKSGREIDLFAEHRLERRRAIGECKATSTATGGDGINKFVGALDAESKRDVPTTGYFISLAGFKETALEQEAQRERTDIIILDGQQIVDELIAGRILIAKHQAIDIAGRWCGPPPNLALDTGAELLAHERGWVWAVYYTHGKLRTHFALIHSDGTPLARVLAEQVIEADRHSGGDLFRLTCLNPGAESECSDAQIKTALAAYARYLDSECGYIQLDGLPADAYLGSRRLQLENLFVPLHVDISSENGGATQRHPVGEILTNYTRIAILAGPGGGKSTLLKRLAIAYVDAERRKEVADDLPDRPWLPLFFRCRELRSLARSSFAELLRVLSEREPVRQYAAAFRGHVDQALLNGRVLLLVDGLDEISDLGDRAAFVGTLRTALQAYPGTGIVVTSRDAGFRHVAAHLASVCQQITLSAFDDDDIHRLSVAWHQEVNGHGEKYREEAEELATTIAQSDRIRRLAVNPLLLTTLFLVRRWIGSLPTHRAILYGEAVKVLLRTWNTEGHEPIPEEEALPQLCYVASAMLQLGMQKISRPRLAALLQDARKSLPTELGYVRNTVDEFIHRIEDRSSLMIMTGYDVEDHRLVEFYEFRHLTFQEYLTARAMIEGWYPESDEANTLVTALAPYFNREDWREVIPLAAVLGGKRAETLIGVLTERVSRIPREGGGSHDTPQLIEILGNCLADEAAARPETIRAAITVLLWHIRSLKFDLLVPVLARGRYGADFKAEVWRALLTNRLDFPWLSMALAIATIEEFRKYRNPGEADNALVECSDMLQSNELHLRCEGAFRCGQLFYSSHQEFRLMGQSEAMELVATRLADMIHSDQRIEQYSATFALSWMGPIRVLTPDERFIDRLIQLWREGPYPNGHVYASIALATHRVMDFQVALSISAEEIRSRFSSVTARPKAALLVIAWYCRAMPNRWIRKKAQETLRLLSNPSSENWGVDLTLNELLERV